jgi:hypothetical protein
VRAAGAANGRNPIAIVLPCHRVIGADGSLTGFGGGLATEARAARPRAVAEPGSSGGAGHALPTPRATSALRNVGGVRHDRRPMSPLDLPQARSPSAEHPFWTWLDRT